MGVLLHEDRMGVFTISVDLTSIPANTTAELVITVPGARREAVYVINKEAYTLGLLYGNIRCQNDGVLRLTIGNLTAAPINAPIAKHQVFWFLPERTLTSVEEA